MGEVGEKPHSSSKMLLAVLPFACLASVSAHGGMMWPPAWQDGVGRPIEALTNSSVFSRPIVKDPNSGRNVFDIKSWLTDQAYTGGVGDEFKGKGPVTNDNNKKLPKFDRCGNSCQKYRNPWAAPGQAPSLGGGCGVFGGNPWGCPAGKDDRPAGSRCGQDEPIGRGMRGTSSFGTDARLFDFPQMITTEWQIGSIQEVVWTSTGSHRGGYTYRLCKMPEGGRTAITEECFTKNVLEFATNFTVIKALNNAGEGTWEMFEQTDLREGTYPEGSVWRPVGKYLKSKLTMRKDSVVVPSTLAPGDYVLGWRWDGSGGNQVWVSCASMKLVSAPSARADDADEEEYLSLYTDQDYAELEDAFESTRTDEDDEDFDGPVYTDEEYEELEGAFENY